MNRLLSGAVVTALIATVIAFYYRHQVNVVESSVAYLGEPDNGTREAPSTSSGSPIDQRIPVDPTPKEPIEAPGSDVGFVSDPRVRGTIRGIVVDQGRRPVSPVIVGLYQRGAIRHQQASLDGSFAFTVYPGEYTAQVVETSLPRGYIAPWNQSQGAPVYTSKPEFSSGCFATEVYVPLTGGEFTVELRVFLAATVSGYVVGPSGEPIERAEVRIQSRAKDAPTGLAFAAHTDAAGRFEMLQVHPGKYRTEVGLSETIDPRYRKLVAPLPERVDVLEGGIYEVQPLRVGAGVKRISGLVQDQDGKPFPNLLITCYLDLEVAAGEMPYNWSSELSRSQTNLDGEFLFGDLSSAKYKLRIGDYEPNALGKCKAAFWIDPIEADLRSVAAIDLPLLQIDESRPFQFLGTIELDAHWAEEHEVILENIRIDIDLLDPQTTPPSAPRRISFRKQRLQIDESAKAFAWMCETPHAPVRIVFKSKGMESPVEVDVYPEPGGIERRVVRIPN